MFLPRDVTSILITPTIDISGAYATGDLLFAANKLLNAALNTKGASRLANVVLLDTDNQKAAIDLLFFDDDPGSLGTLNSAVDMPAAALEKLIGIQNIATGDYTTLKASTNAIGYKSPNLVLPAKVSSKDIWVAGVIRGSATYTVATNLSLKFVLERQG